MLLSLVRLGEPAAWTLQKIRTLELDGKTIKLQIVRCPTHLVALPEVGIPSREGAERGSFVTAVGHGRSGALPHNHKLVLPWRTRYHRGI